MSPRVREILSWYDSETPGVLTNLARIMNHGGLAGTGKMLILPVDQGFEHGPIRSFAINPDAYDPLYHYELAIETGCSAYAAPYGFLKAGAARFAGEIPLILKINNSDSLFSNSESPLPAFTSSVEAALELGCVGIGFTIYPGSTARNSMYEQIAEASKEARKAGLITVIWSYARGKELSKEGETGIDVISYAAQIAAQLGAHIIKVKPPTEFIEQPVAQKVFDEFSLRTKSLEDRTKLVIRSAFNGRRIVIFSGGAAKAKDEVLEEVKALSQGGSFGSIMGRNAFQRPKAEAIELLKDIVGVYCGEY